MIRMVVPMRFGISNDTFKLEQHLGMMMCVNFWSCMFLSGLDTLVIVTATMHEGTLDDEVAEPIRTAQ